MRPGPSHLQMVYRRDRTQLIILTVGMLTTAVGVALIFGIAAML